jgi:glycosyltransferase involved in cell wall biosynthesis
MNKQTLSVVLATYNEENNLSTCLESVKSIANEIIVFDESSTDKTREIAHKYQAKVFKVKHEPIFHITKNKAINKAKSDWILQLDADERLTPEMEKEINDILSVKYFGFDSWISPLKKIINNIHLLFRKPQKLYSPASAYWLPRKNFFLNRYLKHTGQYPDPVIRLFQRGKAILPAKDVHEQMKVDGQIGWLKSDLDHYATPEFSRYLTRENRYSSLKAEELFRQKIKITLFNTIDYLFIKPLITFITLYFRHRGFLDGFPGFVFSLYSGFHHAFSYMKLWEIYRQHDQ